MKIYDITLPLKDTLPVWPGDEAFQYRLNWRIADGASVNVGCICASVHAGTHADAPCHVQEGQLSIDQMDLSAYLGPAVVVDVSDRVAIGVEDVAVEGLASMPRLLLRTGAWLDRSRFPSRFPVIREDVPEFLQSQGVVLVGVDVPSVDLFESKDLANHHALNSRGIRILESLFLDDVPAGRYELIALPLKIDGADGAPVRAVLRMLHSE